MAAPKRVPVADGLFADTPDGPRLLGSRCRGCGTPYFPKSAVCHHPDCSGGTMEDARFGPRGTLWSCAIQDYPPPAPARYDQPYAPYAMGVVDLDDGLRVLGRIAADDPRSLDVGIDVELVLDVLCHDQSGDEVITWKFRPRGRSG
jgi:uncharacterized OB-fold protein